MPQLAPCGFPDTILAYTLSFDEYRKLPVWNVIRLEDEDGKEAALYEHYDRYGNKTDGFSRKCVKILRKADQKITYRTPYCWYIVFLPEFNSWLVIAEKNNSSFGDAISSLVSISEPVIDKMFRPNDFAFKLIKEFYGTESR